MKNSRIDKPGTADVNTVLNELRYACAALIAIVPVIGVADMRVLNTQQKIAAREAISEAQRHLR